MKFTLKQLYIFSDCRHNNEVQERETGSNPIMVMGVTVSQTTNIQGILFIVNDIRASFSLCYFLITLKIT